MDYNMDSRDGSGAKNARKIAAEEERAQDAVG